MPGSDKGRTAAPPAESGGERSTLVDLTLVLAEELPCWWSTHTPYQHKTFNYFTDRPDDAAPLLSRAGPYQTRWLLIDEHTGTHVDAPAHFVPPPGSGLPHAGEPGAVTVDRVPIQQLAGRAAVIDVPENLPGASPGVSPAIGSDVLDEHEQRFGRIEPGTIVLFHTGWDRRCLPGEAGNGYCFDALVTKTGPGWPAPEVPISLYFDTIDPRQWGCPPGTGNASRYWIDEQPAGAPATSCSTRGSTPTWSRAGATTPGRVAHRRAV